MVLYCVGSTGDIIPMIQMGGILHRMGYNVVVITHRELFKNLPANFIKIGLDLSSDFMLNVARELMGYEPMNINKGMEMVHAMVMGVRKMFDV